MKKTALILVLMLALIAVLSACGDNTKTPGNSTDPSVTDPSVTDPAGPVKDRSLLLGKWKFVGSDATVEITENKMTETDGQSVTFDYTVISEKLDGDENYVCVVYANDSNITYMVYKAKSGYGEYGYMEIITNKQTLDCTK